MATYWANLALAPVNGFSILNHLPSMHLPTRVESDVLKRARLVLRQEFSSTLPEELLQFSAARTVAELVFYVIEWDRMPAAFNPAKSVLEFCMDTLADKVYPEVCKTSFTRSLITLSDAPAQIVSDFGRVLDAMDVATRLLVVQLVNSEVGVEENKLPRGLLRYFRPYMRPTAHVSPFSKLVCVDSPIVYAALAVRMLACGSPAPLLSPDASAPGTCGCRGPSRFTARREPAHHGFREALALLRVW